MENAAAVGWRVANTTRLPPKDLGGRRCDWLDDTVHSRSGSPAMQEWVLGHAAPEGDDGSKEPQSRQRQAANAWESYQELDRAAALIRTVRGEVCERILSRASLLVALSPEDLTALNYLLEDLTIRLHSVIRNLEPAFPPRGREPFEQKAAAARIQTVLCPVLLLLCDKFHDVVCEVKAEARADLLSQRKTRSAPGSFHAAKATADHPFGGSNDLAPFPK